MLHGRHAQVLGVHDSLEDASVVLELEPSAPGARFTGSHA